MVIIIRLMGGVGNQMFQYALGKVMALSLNRKLVIETGRLRATKSVSGITPRNFDLDIFVNARDSHVGILSIINCIV